MLWHEKKWPEILKLDRNIPVMIPLGSCEQHGPHMPLITDTIQVGAIAEAVEKAIPSKVLALPPLWLGCSHHHLDFTGTVSVKPTLYSEMIKDIARCFLKAGFRKIFFLNGHGGNDAPATHALTELTVEDDCADDAYLMFASWWFLAREQLKDPALGMDTPVLTHACEYETSFVLFLRPDLVDMKSVGEPQSMLIRPWMKKEWNGFVKGFRRFHRMTATGALGDATTANADKGQRIKDAVVKQVIEFLEDFATWPEMPKIGPKK